MILTIYDYDTEKDYTTRTYIGVDNLEEAYQIYTSYEGDIKSGTIEDTNGKLLYYFD